MNYKIREYVKSKDSNAGYRIWREVGWLQEGQEKTLDTFLQGCDSWVIDINESAEFLIVTASGDLLYNGVKLPISPVLGVTTSQIARKKGIATFGTAQAIDKAVEKGAVLSALGIFEQGFYNNLGFGSGGYEHIIHFDPADLKVNQDFKIPSRFSSKDYELIHQARMKRKRTHGSLNIFSDKITEAESLWQKGSYGLGYYNETKTEITHFIWLVNRGGEHGPYRVLTMIYQNQKQFLELLALLKSLGDQIRSVILTEPSDVQFQDFLRYPFRNRIVTEKGKYANTIDAISNWQIRICDLDKCIEAISCNDELSFNLELHDPIINYLTESDKWKGISGKYTVSLGRRSSVKRGFSENLPTLDASVSGFSRMWLGICKASILVMTEHFQAPEELLLKLDEIFNLPSPRLDWDI